MGEPVPGLVMVSVVASDVIMAYSCAGEAVGFSPWRMEMTPATCGAAMEVPEMVLSDAGLPR